MSNLITVLIPEQNFELVRTRIGEILFTELQYQVSLGFDINPDIYVERLSAFDKSELPAINISLSTGNYDNETVKESDGTYTYNIDVYTSSKANSSDNGDKRASLKLQKLIGAVRSILRNPVYKTLGYEPPFISYTTISGFQVSDPQNINDTDNVMSGRINFVVKVRETTSLIVPRLIYGYFTNVTLDETNDGYIFSEYGGGSPVAPPSTFSVTVNDVNYGSTAFDDFNVVVVNEDDEPVGSLVDGVWQVPNGGIEEIDITVNSNPFATATTSPYDVEVVDSLDSPVGTIGGGKVNIGDATVLVKDSANLTLHTVTVVAEGSENQIVSDSTVLVKNSAGTTLHTTTVKAENTANQTVSDSVININGVNEDIVLAEATFTMFVTVDGVQAGTYDEPTKTVEIVSDVFNKLFFEATEITSAEITIDSDSAGTFTSFTDDGSSGTVTININGGGFGAFVNPTTLVATDTVQLSRTTTTVVGWGKLIGTK